jgi:predicted ATPase
MLAGHLPFSVTDALDIIHAHMTEIPVPLHELNPQIPQILSDIISALMAKQVTDRYQTAYTLEVDLQHCLSEWKLQRKIPNFPIRVHDVPAQLTLPEKLYGRNHELAELDDWYANVEKGKVEIVMVTGDPGAGKTALIKEMRYKLLNHKCFFIQGKFDQYKKDYSLAALAQAIHDFTLQLMPLKNDKYQEWCLKLKTALGPSGKILTDLVPNLTKMVGEQPPLEELDPNQSFNRLIYTLQNFIQAIATPEHPLVIFLDDLQWADNVTLRWLKELASPSMTQLSHLMIIGAYRHQEVELHALTQTLQTMAEFHPIYSIHVDALQEKVVGEWLADALYTNTN